MFPARIKRYVERALEAGLVKTARIVLYRASGYALYIPRLLQRLFLERQPPPAFDHRADRRSAWKQPRFTLLWQDQDLRRLRSYWSSETARTAHACPALDRADTFLAGNLSLLGWGHVSTSVPPPWHSDLYRKIDWPLRFHKRIDYVRPDSECDVKVPWEVSRMQFLPWLGQAWLASGEPVYVARLWDILRDWIIRNPPGYGVNWTCSMEVSIRAINIAAAANLVGPCLTPVEEQWVRRALVEHYRHILFNLEFSDVNGNHFLFDLLGVAVLSIVLSGSESRRTARHVRRFVEEALRQFHPDGVHFENATGYHRLTTDALVFFRLVCERHAITLPERYEETVTRALFFLQSICTNDGSIPLVGDADSGNLLILGAGKGNDVRPLLQAGRTIPGNGTPVADEPLCEETAWLFPDPDGMRAARTSARPERHDELAVHSFSDSGYFIARHRETRLTIRCGESGLRGRGSHDHNDQLSFCLSLFGRPFLIDPGTSNYTSSEADHVGDLSTFRHNTVTVGGKEQSVVRMGSVARTVRSAKATCHGFGRDESGRVYFRGKIDNYERENSGLCHERSIEILGSTADLLHLRIVDTVRSSSEAAIDCIANFMIHPAWRAIETSANPMVVGLRSDFAVASMSFEGGTNRPLMTAETYSPEYGTKVPCSAVRMPFSGPGNAVLVTVLQCSSRIFPKQETE